MTFSKEDNRQKLTVRISSDLDERLAEKDNKSEFVRKAIWEKLGTPDESETPRIPPADDPALARAYRTIVALADGKYVRPEAILPAISADLGVSKSVVRHTVMVSLEKRGYLSLVSDATGREERYKIHE